MKKSLIFFLICLLSLGTLFVFASCDNTQQDVSDQQSQQPEEPSEPIEVENGLAVYMPSDRPIRIAQFADIHFGDEAKPYHNGNTLRTKEYMQSIVDTHKPDLIVCSGDNIMSTGVEALADFVALMESYKTPWTFIYGNHDAESSEEGYNKKSLSDYLETCETEYLLYDAGYIDETANRYGNFSISVLNAAGTKQLGAIILLDNGVYNGAISSYDSITEGQIQWYKSEIDKLSALYTGEGSMPSIVFSHIQLPEFYTAYKAARGNNGATFIIDQQLSSSDVESVRTGGPTAENTGMFEAMKEKGSVAYFCGHAHLYDFQVEMDGIVLGFGPQTGFSTLFENNDLPRHSYMYCVDESFEFTTVSCVEDGSNLGLTFSGAFDGVGEYDEAEKLYRVERNFNYGNDIVFAYNGQRLTLDTITVTGDFREGTEHNYKGGFFSPDGKAFSFDDTNSLTCVFVFDPATNTLNITVNEIEVDPNAPTSTTVKSVNVDAGADAIAVWTEAGTKIKFIDDASTGEGDWIGHGWRYYIVIDSEGRIAYAVLYPLSGYGGPTGNGYYTNIVYSDYTTNPAIKMLDGFADDWAAGGFGYKLYEVEVPEGGFAITSHGQTNFTLMDMFSQGTLETYDAPTVNTKTVYNHNIRVFYDEETKTISVTTVD